MKTIELIVITDCYSYADRNETYNVRLHIRLPRNLDGKKLNPGVKAVRPQQVIICNRYFFTSTFKVPLDT